MTKNRPLPVNNELLQHLDFRRLGQELRQEEAYQKTAKSARSLVRGAEFTMVLVALQEGAHLKEHHSSGPATAIVLEGEVDFSCPDQEQAFQVGPMQSVVFSKHVQHAVRANKSTLMVVVFGQKEV